MEVCRDVRRQLLGVDRVEHAYMRRGYRNVLAGPDSQLRDVDCGLVELRHCWLTHRLPPRLHRRLVQRCGQEMLRARGQDGPASWPIIHWMSDKVHSQGGQVRRIVLAALVFLGCGDSLSPNVSVVDVQNSASKEVDAVYFRTCGAGAWTRNQLTEPIPASGKASIETNPGCTDIEAWGRQPVPQSLIDMGFPPGTMPHMMERDLGANLVGGKRYEFVVR